MFHAFAILHFISPHTTMYRPNDASCFSDFRLTYTVSCRYSCLEYYVPTVLAVVGVLLCQTVLYRQTLFIGLFDSFYLSFLSLL
jgi:hypothetical protein